MLVLEAVRAVQVAQKWKKFKNQRGRDGVDGAFWEDSQAGVVVLQVLGVQEQWLRRGRMRQRRNRVDLMMGLASLLFVVEGELSITLGGTI